MNIEQKRRELFDGWWATSGMEKFKETAWTAFNAALDAVVIELPHDVSHVTCPPFEEGRDAVLAAIESTGLGLKVRP